MKYALAIVLLPDSKVTNLCLKLNQEVLKEGRASLRLGKTRVPHISLAVGCMERQGLARLKVALKEINASSIKTAVTAISHFDPGKPGSPENKGCLELKNTAVLQALQRKIVKAIKPFLFYQATPAMFIKPSEVKESTLESVNQYMAKYAKRYRPHISLKGWGFPNKKLNLPFTINTLAVFQMGEGCTCRKLLFSVRLKNE